MFQGFSRDGSFCHGTGHLSRVGSGRVGSSRVGSGRVGSGRVGSGRVGSGRVRSGRVRVIFSHHDAEDRGGDKHEVQGRHELLHEQLPRWFGRRRGELVRPDHAQHLGGRRSERQKKNGVSSIFVYFRWVRCCNITSLELHRRLGGRTTCGIIFQLWKG